jgi:hypothetical protein
LSGSESVGGVKNFTNDLTIGATNTNLLTLNSKVLVNGVQVTPTELSALNGIGTTSIISQLNSKLSSSNPTFSGTLTGASIVDNGSFSASGNVTLGTNTTNTLTLNSKISANAVNVSPTELSYVNGATSNLQTQLNSKPSLSTTNAFSGLNSFSTDTTLNKLILTGNLVLNSGATTVTNSELCFINGATSNLQTQINGKVNNSGAETIAGNKVFSGQTTLGNSYLSGVNMLQNMVENVSTATVTSNALSVQIGSANSVISITPSSANNMTLTVSFVSFLSSQLSASFYGSVTMSFIINTATNKQYINSVIYGGTTYTPIAAGGLSNVSVNTSSVYVLQTITLLFLSSATPTKIITSVSSLF